MRNRCIRSVDNNFNGVFACFSMKMFSPMIGGRANAQDR